MRRSLFFAVLVGVVALALGACASAPRPATAVYPATPAYEPSAPVPITVALKIDEAATVQSRGRSHVNEPYGPMIASDLKKMKLFGNVVYPYESGAAANQKAVLHLSITGGWSYFDEDYTPYDYWGGQPLHHHAKGDHEVKITLTAQGREIFSKTIPVKSDLGYRGHDANRVAALLNRAQAGRIAIEVAKVIEARHYMIMSQVVNRPAEAGVSPYMPPSAYVPAPSPAYQVNTPPPAVPRQAINSAPLTGAQEAGMGKKIEELEALHKQGVLSDADFNAARNRLLNIRKLDDLYRTGVITLPEYQKARAKIMEK